MTNAERFSVAVQKHQSGDLAAAGELYRQIVDSDAMHADAVHGLGLIAHQAGRRQEARELIERAIAIKPDVAYYHLNLGSILTTAGRLDDAVAALNRALQLQPKFPQAHYNLGNAFCDQTKWPQAAAAYRQALELRPDHADSHFNLAYVLDQMGDAAGAWDEARRAIELRPDFAEAHHLTGLLLQRQRRTEEAIVAYGRALARRPDWPELLNNLGNALRESGRLTQATAMLRRAAALLPDSAPTQLNLAAALRASGELAEARLAIERAIAHRPGDIEARNSLGGMLHAEGKLAEAEAVYRQIIAENPDYAHAHWDLSLVLLTQRKYAEGWREYEWRWRVEQLRLGARADSPRWDGAQFSGKTLLLHGEQGLGDAIQFLRYVPMVVARGGTVVLVCRRELMGLASHLTGVEVAPDDRAWPAHDANCPLASLPMVLGGDVPEETPYLAPSPELAAQWKSRLGDDRTPRVGLVWAGRNYPDPLRSVPLEMLAPLAEIPGIRWISLQTGDAAYEKPPAGLRMERFTAELKDLEQTAALMTNLDLIITIDTATAHLAGAVGRDAWVILKSVPDWRWGMTAEQTPWYPTLRLFRQTRLGDWAGVVGSISEELRLWASGDSVKRTEHALMFTRQAKYDQAVSVFRWLSARRPDCLVTANNLATALREAGRLEESIAQFRSLLAKAPDDPLGHWGLAQALLQNGDYAEGWREYEWRWKVPQLRLRLKLPTPRWNGEDLSGKTLVVHGEQGLGDNIQFARYIPQVVLRRPAKLLLVCQRELMNLLGSMPGIDGVYDDLTPPPPHDLHVPVASLPLVFGDSPADVPYLNAGEPWRLTGDGRAVGIAWRGLKIHPNDHHRSIAVEQLAPLAKLNDVRFCSLQKDDPAPSWMTDYSAKLTDFTQTAGLIAALDLVISVDTAVAHLAGALGKPVWLLLPFSPDWRWMSKRADSPWYPTMRIFRQRRGGDWGEVLAQVAAALEGL